MKTWLISDTHFGHKNIVKYCERPENHNELMVANWQKLVAPEDRIIHLGDVFMGKESKEFASAIFPALPGEKSLILGNHDHETKKFYEGLGFYVCEHYKVWVPHDYAKMGSVVMTHYPLCRDYPTWKVNIHGHIHNQGYAPGTPRKRRYVNVSVEVTDYAPVLLEDVLEGRAGQERWAAHDWSFSKVVEMRGQDRLDDHFCEIEKLDRAHYV